jgi:hypothetical protein
VVHIERIGRRLDAYGRWVRLKAAWYDRIGEVGGAL